MTPPVWFFPVVSPVMIKPLFFLAAIACGLVSAPRAAALDELQPRGGLPNFRAKLSSGKPVCIAFLGGSITASQGWRVLVRGHLKAS